MLTNPYTRRRFRASHVMMAAPVPGRGRIAPPAPGPSLSYQVAPAPFYTYTPGDLFDPGTMNWVYMPAYETPLNTTWGHGFALLHQPKPSHIIGPVQTYAQPTVTQFWFRGMPALQFDPNSSLQIDVNTGAIVGNPIAPSSGASPEWMGTGETDIPYGASGDFGVPPVSITPAAGLSFGYSGDGSTDGLTGD